MNVLVTAAGGNVGSAVMAQLRARGVPARAFDRRAETIEAAMQHVDRLFLACPNVPEQVEFETRAIDAAAAAGVKRVVKLSAFGATEGSPLTFFDWHGRIERHLQASGVPAVVLRPVNYMTNLLMSAETIAATGKLFAPAGDATVAMIDPRDVGAVAAAALVDDGIAPGAYVLTGPRALTYAEIAAELGAEYVDVLPEAARHGALQSGLPPLVADFLVGLFGEIRRGAMAQPTTTVRDLTGREPRDLAEFARQRFGALDARERDQRPAEPPHQSERVRERPPFPAILMDGSDEARAGDLRREDSRSPRGRRTETLLPCASLSHQAEAEASAQHREID